ncbi:MAG: hypothetical protein QM793_03370 [Muricomes sp.]
MTHSEFLQELRRALENDLSGRIVEENVEFYSQYIKDEVKQGKSEEEILQMLGDPWVLAKTVIDAQDGTDEATVYGTSRKSDTEYSNERSGREKPDMQVNMFRVDTWWKKLLWTLVIIMLVLGVVAIVTGVIRFLAPVLIPLLLITLVIRAIGGGRRR